jgi:N-acetylmuramoyl-L-alanine amidase
MIIKRGDKGLRVMAVQEMLDLKPADGIFGPKTEEAVKAFQNRNGLVVDGIVGDKTLAVLSKSNNQDYTYQLINPNKQTSRTITHLFVHCTAGDQNTTPEQLLDFFYNVKHWSRPGYHYVVSKNGTVTQLWPESKYSNGVKGMNPNSINVAWIGGIDKQHPNGIDNRTDAQKEALRRVMKELKRKYPKAKIMGHRDTSEDKNHNGIIDPWERIKECPCFDAMVEYKDL